MSVVSADFGDLLLVAVDAPEGADIIPVDEAFGVFLFGRDGASEGETPQQSLLEYTHIDIIIDIKLKNDTVLIFS